MASVSIGYTLSSEEHTPSTLVANAQKAEEAGFEFLSISDHYFPWVETQGQSGFVWAVLGGVAQVTKKVPVMTGVTCPIVRIHPVILAQAAATTAELFKGRFMFGVGTGENLNEHVIGAGWPNVEIRLEMLEEAISIIRELWRGKLTNIQGAYFSVDQAKIYSLPSSPPPIIMSASGPKAATLAGKTADALVTTSPDAEVVQAFRDHGGEGKPIYGQITVCYDENEQRAKEVAAKIWPNSAISGQASQELPLPLHFEQLAKAVTPDIIAAQVVCGNNPQQHMEQIQQYIDVGFTHLYIHQVGHNQDKFMGFYKEHILPEYKD